MDPYYWIQSTPSSKPRNAVKGGYDEDGSDIYVGRSFHLGEKIPAKVIPSKNACYVSYDGAEILKRDCEILCERKLEWVKEHGGVIAPNSIPAGRTTTGETLYVGRVHHNGSLTVGKVQHSHKCCYIPFGGEELSFKEYEILVYQ